MPDPITTAAIISAGAQTGNNIFSMFGQRRRERRAMENQRQLMDIHQRHQMQLNQQGQALQMQTWNETNYPAQVKMLQEAGMNPALLYGKGGAGGVTGSQGGGSAASGHAPAPQPMPGLLPSAMDIAQIAKLKSEIKANESVANRNNADADKTRGVDTDETRARTNESIARLGEIAANIENKEAQTEVLDIQKNILKLDEQLKDRTLESMIRRSETELEKALEELKSLKVKAKIDENTYENVLKLSANAVTRSFLDNALVRSQTDLNRQEIETQKTQLAQNAEKLILESRHLDNEEFRNAIAKFEAEAKVNYPNIWNVAGAGVMNLCNAARYLIGSPHWKGSNYVGD